MAFNSYDAEDAAFAAGHAEAGTIKRHRRNKKLEALLKRCLPFLNAQPALAGEIKDALATNFYSESDAPLPANESLYW
jgi:hypothetical protein